MEIKVGDIVLSTKGRDRNHYFYVLKIDGNFAFIADGMTRKVDKPKKKKLKHINYILTPNTRLKDKLISDDKIFDAEIRKSIRQMNLNDEDELIDTDDLGCTKDCERNENFNG